jgi:predicted nuclease of predicted toxin-antitoxin system
MRKILTKDQVSDFKRKFESKARFLVDESVGMEAARLIRDRGWNVRYVEDVGLLGRSGEEVLAFAWKEQRILLTHGFDFLDDSRFPFHRNPGLVVLPGATGSRLGLADAINGVLALIGPYFKAYRGYKIRITEDGVWTIRPFNTEEGIHQEIRVKFGKTKCGSGIDDTP